MSLSPDSAPAAARLVPFAYGFRPFFLAAGWYALVAIVVWASLYMRGSSPFGPLPPYLWHGHEMLFGFVTAAIAGFMLAAVPSWTGNRGFSGWPLVVLTLVWLAGRLAFGAAGWIPLPVLAVAELAFLPALALTLCRDLHADPRSAAGGWKARVSAKGHVASPERKWRSWPAEIVPPRTTER